MVQENACARGVTPLYADLCDAAGLAQAARRADGVIHLAASFGPDWQVGDRTAVQAILMALEGSSKPFVYTSIATVYGDTGAIVADEGSALPGAQGRAPSPAGPKPAGAGERTAR